MLTSVDGGKLVRFFAAIFFIALCFSIFSLSYFHKVLENISFGGGVSGVCAFGDSIIVGDNCRLAVTKTNRIPKYLAYSSDPASHTIFSILQTESQSISALYQYSKQLLQVQ